MPDLVLLPSGHLSFVEDANQTATALPEALAAPLTRAFGKGTSEGLLCLATLRHDAALPAHFQFWRRLSDQVMAVVTDKDQGLFPHPKEIKLKCSYPDWADMCKHVAAVLYGVGARLDEKPEMLFLLRGVDHAELVGADAARAVVTKAPAEKGRILDAAGLSDVFGIELAQGGGGKVSEAAPAVLKPRTAKGRNLNIPSARAKGSLRKKAAGAGGKPGRKPKRRKGK